MLVIGDSTAPSAIAGRDGQRNVRKSTTNTHTIVFESACFLGSSVRTTAKKVGLRTEASARYEKGLDPNTCQIAVERACELVELLGAGEVVDGAIDVYPTPRLPREIPFEPEWTNRFLGIQLTEAEMVSMLERLDIPVRDGKVIAPTYRPDLESKADIAEEVARMYGYDSNTTSRSRIT